MGKTEKGAVWLDAEKTSPYEFYQYWRNIADADVLKCIRMLTFIPLETIEEMENWDGSRINEKKEILAFELTKLVHGEEEAQKALETARNMFSGAADTSNMPTTTLTADDFVDGKITVADMLVKSKLAPSKGEAKRLIQQGGILVNDEKITDFGFAVSVDSFGEGIIIKKGKKSYQRFVIA